MNKLFKGLVLAALSTGAVCAHHTNHTTIALRSHGYNLPMNYTTYHELMSDKADNKFGGKYQSSSFYQASNSKDELGKYFGIEHKHVITLDRTVANESDLNLGYLLHNTAAAAAAVTVKFHPESISYGTTLAYHQDLAKIAKGLYMSASMPLVHIENNMHMVITDVTGTRATDLANYFNGTYFLNASAGQVNAQEKLTRAKISGKQSVTGIADVDVKLGYNFVEKEDYRLGINFGFTIPMGNKNEVYNVFSPVVGNGDHWAVGAGLESFYTIWDKDEQNIKLGMVVDYRYLFESNEYRTPGLKDADGVTRNWGQYTLLGNINNNIAATGVTCGYTQLTPAANVITQRCEVTPGSQVEGLVNFAYNNGGFVFDLGYNVFWKEKEKVVSKQTLAANTYGVAALTEATGYADLSSTSAANSHYTGLASYTFALSTGTQSLSLGSSSYPATSYVTNNIGEFYTGTATGSATDSSLGTIGSDGRTLTQSDLDFNRAATDDVLTHKVYAGLGYSFKEWEAPLMMGIGGSYEFADENSAADFWAVYGKLGVAF